MKPEVYERKKNVLISVINERFNARQYKSTEWPKLEKATDQALDALRAGTKLIECVAMIEKSVRSS